MSCLSPYAWWDTEMAGSVLLHHCWRKSQGDDTNLPILDCRDSYMKFLSSQRWNTEINHAIEFRSPSQRKSVSACHCSNPTYIGITYMQLKHWFLSSLHSTSGCITITQAFKKSAQHMPERDTRGYTCPESLYLSLLAQVWLLSSWYQRDSKIVLLQYLTITTHTPIRMVTWHDKPHFQPPLILSKGGICGTSLRTIDISITELFNINEVLGP